jgi:hypothetical protein
MSHFSSHLCVPALLAIILHPHALLSAEPLLPPIYQPGREYVIRSVQHAETVAGFSAKTQAKQVADIELEVRSVCQTNKTSPALRDVLIELTALKMVFRLGSVEMNYDSQDPKSGETLLGQTFRELVGKSFSVTLDDQGAIVESHGMEQFDTGNNIIAQQLGPEQLKQIATPALRLGVPGKGAAIGETWKEQREVSLGTEQKLVADFDVRYARDELLENRPHGVLEYGADIDADLQIPAPDGKGASTVIQIRKGRLNGAMSIDKELRFPRSGMAMTSMTMTLPNPANPKENIELPVEQSMSFDLLSTRKLGMFEKP